MNIFVFSSSWYILLSITLAIFIGLFVYRKSYAKNEIKQQLVFAVIVFALSVVSELIGAGNLWNYTEGNWPAVLWVVYFFGGLAGYQVAKLVAERVK